MNDTDQLIDSLAARAGPVQRLSSPLWRTVQWVALAALVVAAIVVFRGVRPDFAQRVVEPGTAIEWVASVLTGVLAAYAAFQVSVPGRSPSWAWLPFPAAVLWLTGIGLGCMGDFSEQGAGAFAFQGESWECARAITFISLPLGFVMLWMVRHAGVVRPVPTALLAGLSSAALSAAGVSLMHVGESSLMTLFWHIGAVALLSAASAWWSGRLFAWIGYARR